MSTLQSHEIDKFNALSILSRLWSNKEKYHRIYKQCESQLWKVVFDIIATYIRDSPDDQHASRLLCAFTQEEQAKIRKLYNEYVEGADKLTY
jgi:diketogulonate reductase-like aldo/keto reductase